MKIVFGCDHAGFKLKSPIVRYLKAKKFRVLDLGCWDSHTRVDYPDFANRVARMVSQKKADVGILCCGTGIGMGISANKIKNIRAAVLWNKKTAQLAKEHNWANVLCLGGRLLTSVRATEILKAYFSSRLEPRHATRIRKISKMESAR